MYFTIFLAAILNFAEFEALLLNKFSQTFNPSLYRSKWAQIRKFILNPNLVQPKINSYYTKWSDTAAILDFLALSYSDRIAIIHFWKCLIDPYKMV